jgi:pimeloyl-ACP methyl ester carboxylesterase
VTRPFPHVEGVEHRFLDVGGLWLHVAEAGDGEPLLMLHGWPQHWYEWRHQIPELSKRYRVICPDFRGFGWSDAPAVGYDKETLAADIVKLLDALHLDKVKLVGHDWGGWAGFLLCMQHPERVERFVALNIPPPWGKVDLQSLRSLWRFWYQYLLASPLLGEWILRHTDFVRLILTGGSSSQRIWSDAELAAFIEPLREPKRAKASVQLYRTFLLREFPQIARGRYRRFRLETPTLLLFGVEDLAISTSMLRGYEPFVDDMTLELVPDTGHFIAEEQPELVTRRTLEFFGAEVGPTPTPKPARKTAAPGARAG